MMDRAAPSGLAAWLVDEAQRARLAGDLSDLSVTGRMAIAPLRWSFASRLIPWLHTASALLAIGTGRGDLLARLQTRPARMAATESFAPHIPLARMRLGPLGVDLRASQPGAPLPFADASFDLIICRHSLYQPAEVARLLQPGGHFITQQIGPRNDHQLLERLGISPPPCPPWPAIWAPEPLVAAGLRVVEYDEDHPATRFYDIGAIVYYLSASAWPLPDFSVERYWPPLLNLQREIADRGYVETTSHRCLIIATKTTKSA